MTKQALEMQDIAVAHMHNKNLKINLNNTDGRNSAAIYRKIKEK